MKNPLRMVRRLLHLETAAEYREHTAGCIDALRAEAVDALHGGKEHHWERAARGRAIAELRAQPRYIDACRVARGAPPLNGFFASEEAKGSGERTAGSEGPPPASPAEDEGADVVGGDADDLERRLLLGWRRRATRLEARLTGPVEAPPKVAAHVDEFEHIAQEVVQYRQTLKQQCGYRSKDLKENRDVQLLEARLDTLAGAFLPEEEMEHVELESEAEELRQRERRPMATLARRTQSVSGLKVERLLGEIAELQGSLSAQGFTEHEQERQELEGILEQVVDKLEAHKRRLRQEQGLSQKDLRQD